MSLLGRGAAAAHADVLVTSVNIHSAYWWPRGFAPSADVSRCGMLTLGLADERCGSGEDTVVCLQCGRCGCGRDTVGHHALQHYADAQHSLTMALATGAVFCYACNEWVVVDNAYGGVEVRAAAGAASVVCAPLVGPLARRHASCHVRGARGCHGRRGRGWGMPWQCALVPLSPLQRYGCSMAAVLGVVLVRCVRR